MTKGGRKKPIERIQVSKNDEIALIVERIIDSKAEEVILTIPRFSKLVESSANFHLIKRESDLLKKRIVIESVDDKVIEFSEGVGLESLNPILVKRKQFSDIVSAPPPAALEEEVAGEPIAAEPAPIKEPPLVEETTEKPKIFKKLKISKPSINVEMPKVKVGLPKKRTLKVFIVGLIGLFIIVSIAKALPRVDIEITNAKTPWSFEEEITLTKSGGTAQVFNDSRNINLSFPASGNERIERHAKGTIIVYNAYSSDPQPLVKRTRFVTPDGKIFRLVEGITVPPAEIIAGKITPSSITAEVIADEPGDDYNIGPIDYYSVPGFKGTDKYSGFYGKSTGSMSGGKIGETAVPTDGDIRVAKETVSEKIKEIVTASLLSSLPEDFIILEGSSDFQIVKQKVIEETDSQGNFSVFAEAEMDVVGFKEADVIEVVLTEMKKELGEEYNFKSFEIEYGDAVSNFDSGTITLPVKFTGIAHRPIDIEVLRSDILGKSEEDLQSTISLIPGFEDGQVSFWPFWVKTVPEKPGRVRIDIL